MGNHTPGPWVIHRRSHAAGDLWLDIGYRLPDGTERGPVCDITGKMPVDEHARRFRSAAEIKYLVTPEAEQWANARLIAAAPELLAALQCQQAIEDHSLECLYCLHDDDCTERQRLIADAGVAREDALAKTTKR